MPMTVVGHIAEQRQRLQDSIVTGATDALRTANIMRVPTQRLDKVHACG